MKVKRKNHKILFRGTMFTMAFALSVLCVPVDGFVASAEVALTDTNFSYLTIGKEGEDFATVVAKGATFTIPNAYVGGDFKVGDQIPSNATNTDSETLESTEVKVTYGGQNVELSGNTFVADKVGTYVITYSYTYSSEGKSYTNSYDLKVESEISTATLSFKDNMKNFIPSIIDMAQVKKAGLEKIVLPKVEIKDKNGEVVEGATFVTKKSEVQAHGDFVLVTFDDQEDKIAKAEDEFSIAANTLTAGRHTFKYSYYRDNQFVVSTTKTTEVYAEDDKYYTDYKLKLDVVPEWTNNGQTGVESKLPVASVTVAKSKNSENEKIDAYYTVKVKYKASNSETYADLSKELYADVLNADGTLKDVTKFMPLKDGYYTFVYTATDIYGNKSLPVGEHIFEFKDVKDEQKPTPIIYEATKAEKEIEDESYKLASRSNPNGVVVYAIGMKDNVSKAGDEKVELTRKIMVNASEVKLTISDYDEYNLVFNYRETASKAYQNLKVNNYLIGKQTSGVASDVDMLNWLNENKYKIVVDNANYKHIYGIFKEAEFLTGKTEETSLDWFKTEEAKTKGFAFIDAKETFGATSSDSGMGSGQYYIHYIAKDAAGKEAEISKAMYIGSYQDMGLPTIKFPTTLADSYLPGTKITFETPTVKDEGGLDSNMKLETMYRYLNESGDVVAIAEKSNKDLTALWNDITTSANEDVQALATKFADFHKAGGSDGYISLTDKDASSYTIDLSEVGDAVATKLQIISYTYDDAGNIGFYAEEVSISNAKDEHAPSFVSLDEPVVVGDYQQGDEIVLPEIVVNDDKVAFVGFDVKVYHLGETKTLISNYDSYAKRDVKSLSGMGTFTGVGGKFMAQFAGDYQVCFTVVDGNNKVINAYKYYTVKPRNIVQAPAINVAIDNQTIQLDGDSNYDPEIGLKIPTPSISYEIPNSITYDEFVKASAPIDESIKYVVKGVDSNGKATNALPNLSEIKGNAFKPTKVGEYNIQYKANVTVYDRTMFTFEEMKWEGSDYVEGGYTISNNATTATVVLNENNEFEVSTSEKGDFVIKQENGVAKVYQADVEAEPMEYEGTALENDYFKDWFDQMINYTLVSDEYTINVEDTKGPKISNYDYQSTIKKEDIAKPEGYDLKVYGIQASDKSGIDFKKSKVSLDIRYADGTSTQKDFGALIEDTVYKIESSAGIVRDGTYTITYTVYDNSKQQNRTEAKYTINVGDTEKPKLTVPEDFVKSEYEIDNSKDPLIIDPSKLVYTDNATETKDIKLEIKLFDSSRNELKLTENESGTLSYVFDKVGVYTLKIKVTDAVGWSEDKEITITVAEKTTDTVMTYKVIGTVLIVISVLVLVGVIIYFIVAKVKLDKELKK